MLDTSDESEDKMMEDHLGLSERWVKEEEGFRGTCYRCPSGKWSIAYGRNTEDNPLTEMEGEYLLRNVVFSCIAFLSKELGDDFAKLDSVRKAVLIDLCYWIGPVRFLGFKDMIAAIREGNYSLAASEILDSKLPQDDIPVEFDSEPERVEKLFMRMKTGTDWRR